MFEGAASRLKGKAKFLSLHRITPHFSIFLPWSSVDGHASLSRVIAKTSLPADLEATGSETQYSRKIGGAWRSRDRFEIEITLILHADKR